MSDFNPYKDHEPFWQQMLRMILIFIFIGFGFYLIIHNVTPSLGGWFGGARSNRGYYEYILVFLFAIGGSFYVADVVAKFLYNWIKDKLKP